MVPWTITLIFILRLTPSFAPLAPPLAQPVPGLSLWDKCKEASSCAGNVTSDETGDIYDRNCFCDEACRLFQDCCQDAPNTPSVFDKYTSEDENLFQCVTYYDVSGQPGPWTLEDDSRYTSSSSFWLTINQCPSSFQDYVVKQLCEEAFIFEENPLTHIWVSGVSSGLLFKNVFCAVCHGAFAIEDILFWEQVINCKEYGNSSSAEKEDIDGQHDSFSDSAVEHLTDVTGVLQFVNWTVCYLAMSPPQNVKMPRECKPHIAQCSRRWEWEASFWQARAVTSALCLDSDIDFTYSEPPPGPSVRDFERTVYKNWFCAVCNFEEDVTCKDPGPSSITHPAIIFPKIRFLLDINQGSLVRQKRKGLWVMESTGYGEADVESCPSNSILDVYTGECRTIFCPEGYAMTSDLRCKRLLNIDLTAISLRPANMSCVLTALNITEVNITADSKMLIISLGIILEPEDYVWIDNVTLAACADLFLPPVEEQTWTLDEDTVEGYLTLVGYSLSMLGLLVVFIVYMALPELRNRPGKCLINLVVALFFAQLLFLLIMVPSPSTWTCYILSVAVHYLYLVAFAWMNVMGFDIWRAFHLNSLHPGGTGGKKLLVLYHAYAWAMPIAVVGIAVLFDAEVIPVKSLKPGYADIYCWMSTKWGLVCFFAGPIGLILASNLVFFVLTAINVRRTSTAASRMASSKTGAMSVRKRLLLNIKLSSLMGSAWLFGFLALAAPKSQVLWYIFTILSSLQGLAICLGFVFFSKRVCNRKKTDGRTASTKSGTSSSALSSTNC